MTAKKIKIKGRVQGVGFRWFVCGHARRLGLTGWVRNERDGGLSLWIQGPHREVETLAELIKSGPPGAFVGDFWAEEETPSAKFLGFEILF